MSVNKEQPNSAIIHLNFVSSCFQKQISRVRAQVSLGGKLGRLCSVLSGISIDLFQVLVAGRY